MKAPIAKRIGFLLMERCAVTDQNLPAFHRPESDDEEGGPKKLQGFDGLYFEFRGFKIAIGASVIIALMSFALSHFH